MPVIDGHAASQQADGVPTKMNPLSSQNMVIIHKNCWLLIIIACDKCEPERSMLIGFTSFRVPHPLAINHQVRQEHYTIKAIPEQ